MVKRIFDLCIAAVGMLLLSPVILGLCFLVRRRLGSPVFFSQIRPGRHGKPFRMYKFRSMTDAVGPDGLPLPDAERLPSFGRWLRATSLDELPELWNVLRGDMSIVGPRPLLMQYLPLYSERQRRRHDVRPGITGWSQVNGRNAVDWSQRLEQDVWYVENQSLALDVHIFFLTFRKVVQREGISATGEATMPAFQGNAAPSNSSSSQAK